MTNNPQPTLDVEGLVERLNMAAANGYTDYNIRPLLREAASRLTELKGAYAHAASECGRLAAALGEAKSSLLTITREREAPIDMVLFCPACGTQHIDEPDGAWDNPPHRSHLCHGCGHIWRPADVATNGVAAVKTAGKADSLKTSASLARAGETLMRLDATNARMTDRALRAERERDEARKALEPFARFRLDGFEGEVLEVVPASPDNPARRIEPILASYFRQARSALSVLAGGEEGGSSVAESESTRSARTEGLCKSEGEP